MGRLLLAAIMLAMFIVSVNAIAGAPSGEKPNTLIAWPYASWSPSVILAGQTSRLSAGVTVITLTTTEYTLQVEIYDNNPSINGPPQIISANLGGSCSYSSFYYSNGKWVFYAGPCSVIPPLLFPTSYGITAIWSPKVPGTYDTWVTVCITELLGGCESTYISLTVT